MLRRSFTRRKREAEQEAADLFIYDEIPQKLRVQLIHIFTDAIGPFLNAPYHDYRSGDLWDYIHKEIIEELGVFKLNSTYTSSKGDDFVKWFSTSDYVGAVIDAIELTLQVIDRFVRKSSAMQEDLIVLGADSAIAKANARILEAGVGYQYETGELIRVDNKFVHAEIVRPALKLLQERKYSASNEEFRDGHKAYREGRYEDAIVGAAKAFESILKVIANKRKWNVSATDPASKLIEAAVQAGFLSNLTQSGFTSLRALLESGVMTPRNKTAGHGAGTTPRIVPSHMASFVLNQTAAAIVFLDEHDCATP